MKAPSIPSWTLLWSDEFEGPPGSAASHSSWWHKTGENYNNELQTYTTSTNNIRLSGTGELHLIPLKDQPNPAQPWSSGRLECNHSFTCTAGRKLRITAQIRLGSNPAHQQQGIWPAFWLLGRSVSNPAVSWPRCGEWDILENTNGGGWNMPTVHYRAASGDKAMAHGNRIPIYPGWHTWTIEFDRTPARYAASNPDSWMWEKVTWFIDGYEFWCYRATDVVHSGQGGEQQWAELTREPVFPLLNVAIGGDYPGPPNEQTVPGLESGMAVAYVAVYESQE